MGGPSSELSVTAMSMQAEVAQPSQSDQACYCFGEFELDISAGELRRNGQMLSVTQKSLSVLAYLVLHHGRTVPRTEIVAAVWQDVWVAPGSLNQAVWEIRRVLGESKGSSIIQTSRRRGYRFAVPVRPRAPLRRVVT